MNSLENDTFEKLVKDSIQLLTTETGVSLDEKLIGTTEFTEDTHTHTQDYDKETISYIAKCFGFSIYMNGAIETEFKGKTITVTLDDVKHRIDNKETQTEKEKLKDRCLKIIVMSILNKHGIEGFFQEAKIDEKRKFMTEANKVFSAENLEQDRLDEIQLKELKDKIQLKELLDKIAQRELVKELLVTELMETVRAEHEIANKS